MFDLFVYFGGGKTDCGGLGQQAFRQLPQFLRSFAARLCRCCGGTLDKRAHPAPGGKHERGRRAHPAVGLELLAQDVHEVAQATGAAHAGVGPQLLDDLLSGDDTVAVRQQEDDQIENLGLYGYRLAAAGDLDSCRIDNA